MVLLVKLVKLVKPVSEVKLNNPRLEYGKWESSKRQIDLECGNRRVTGSGSTAGTGMYGSGWTGVPRVVSQSYPGWCPSHTQGGAARARVVPPEPGRCRQSQDQASEPRTRPQSPEPSLRAQNQASKPGPSLKARTKPQSQDLGLRART